MMTVCKLQYIIYVASLPNYTESISLHVTAEEMVRYQIVVKYVGLASCFQLNYFSLM